MKAPKDTNPDGSSRVGSLHYRISAAAISAHHDWVNAPGGGDTYLGDQIADKVLADVVSPFITTLPIVTLGAPCVECFEPFEPADRVTWRLRYSPQGLIHEECQ